MSFPYHPGKSLCILKTILFVYTKVNEQIFSRTSQCAKLF